MASYLTLMSDGIGLLIAALYTLAGQAHFTTYLTPGLAEHVDEMTHNCHAAFWFLGIDYVSVCLLTSHSLPLGQRPLIMWTMQLKQLFGAFDLIAAALLSQQKTRRAGLLMSVVGFSGGLYGQLYSGEDVSQVATMSGVAVLGFVLARVR